MLLEEFLRPMGLTQRELAKAIWVPYQRINGLVNGRRGITPSVALRLAKYFWIRNILQNSDVHVVSRSNSSQDGPGGSTVRLIVSSGTPSQNYRGTSTAGARDCQ